MDVTATFNEAVTVTGTPQIDLTIGATGRKADYESGSTTAQLLFQYTVADTDEDTDGASVNANGLKLNGGSIVRSNTTINADLAHAARTNQSRHKVDGKAPALTRAEVDAGTLTLTYDETLDGSSRPATGDFAVTVDGRSRAVSTVGIRGSTVILELESDVTSAQVVLLGYTSGTNPIRDRARNASNALIGATVKNLDQRLARITLPSGFRIRMYAEGVAGARSMSLSPNGTLFVGTRGHGRVYALRDEDEDDYAERSITLASGLNFPNGVAFKDSSLYVAEASRVLRYPDVENRLTNPPEPELVSDDFPSGTGEDHYWKFIRFGPDDSLYVPIGAPCNVCNRGDPYAVIGRISADSTFNIVARGIRNTVGFDWHPETNELWFTDNGRDGMGDNRPPDELNRITAVGQHFGYPFCHGTDIADPSFGSQRACSEFVAPVQELGPHVAALGMRFYTGSMFPAEYGNQIFIAEHGSWDRSSKIGYRVTLVRLNGNEATSYEAFATGWLQEQSHWGRPVDLQVMSDGSLLVSDDYAGAIYRISYTE